MKLLFYVVLTLLLTSCGGFRGGIQSVPYVDRPDSLIKPLHPSWPHEITLPEVTLKLSFNNVLQTYNYEVMLYVIPTYFNFFDTFRTRDSAALELSFQVIAHESALILDPRQLVLTIDGRDVRPNSVRVNNPDRERQILEAYRVARRQAPQGQTTAIPHASEWHDTITSSVVLHPTEQSRRFVVTFPLPLVSPKTELTLNINPAVLNHPRIEFPLIHFQSTRWSEGYSSLLVTRETGIPLVMFHSQWHHDRLITVYS